MSAQALRGSPRQQQISFGTQLIHYCLTRSGRRTIGLSIDHRGLRVMAPWHSPDSEIENMLRQHGAWVIEKLADWQQRPQPRTLPITHGLKLPVLGQDCEIRILSGSNRSIWSGDGQSLSLLPRPADTAAAATAMLRRLLEKALRQRLLDYALPHLEDFSGRLDLKPPKLTLSAARTRWGSCSHASGIRLNWRLIHYPPHIVDYVIAHEVAHLQEMNHSPRFWSVVEQLYPDWQSARRQLKAMASDLPRF